MADEKDDAKRLEWRKIMIGLSVFTGEMRKQLDANAHKTGFDEKKYIPEYLLAIRARWCMLEHALEEKNREAIIRECANIANYAMFISNMQ